MSKGRKGFEIADNLRDMICLRGISYAELARRSGVTPSSITWYLQGKRLPTVDTVTKLAKALDCPYETLRCGKTPEHDMVSCGIQELIDKNVLSEKYKKILKKTLDCLANKEKEFGLMANVVMCKDCKYGGEMGNGQYYCSCPYYKVRGDHKAGWYCGYGERGEDNE